MAGFVGAQMTWYVAPGGTGSGLSSSDPLGNLQQAIDMAAFGDTVEAARGSYFGPLVVNKAITIRATEGSEVTVIDALWQGSAVQFHSVSTGTPVLQGFLLQSGVSTSNTEAGGIACLAFASPIIRDCIVIGCEGYNGSGPGGPAGISVKAGSPQFERCAVAYCDGSYGTGSFGFPGGAGGGLIEGGAPTFRDCLFVHNRGGRGGVGQSAWGYGSIGGDGGDGGSGGLEIRSGNVLVINCTFTASFGGLGGNGGSACCSAGALNFCSGCNSTHGNPGATGPGGLDVRGGFVNVINTIIRDNGGASVAGFASVTYSNIQGGHTGAGNFDAPPLFVDVSQNDFRLSLNSPCVDTGLDVAALSTTDIEGHPRLYGSAPDVGSDEVVMTMSVEQPTGPGGPVLITHDNLEPGATYQTVFSGELCHPPGSGPWFEALCFTDPTLLFAQLSLPAGTPLWHFTASGPTAQWGPFSVGPVTLDAVFFKTSGPTPGPGIYDRFVVQ